MRCRGGGGGGRIIIAVELGDRLKVSLQFCPRLWLTAVYFLQAHIVRGAACNFIYTF